MNNTSAAAGTRAVAARRGPNAVQRFNRWWLGGLRWLAKDDNFDWCLGMLMLSVTIPIWGPLYCAWWLVASERRPLARLLFGEED